LARADSQRVKVVSALRLIPIQYLPWNILSIYPLTAPWHCSKEVDVSAELRMLIKAKAARIHRLAELEEDGIFSRLSFETAELQAMIAEAIREEHVGRDRSRFA